MPLLATNQRRPNAPIELGPNRERVYFFTPSIPTDQGSVHVADVSDEDYDHLIKIEGYFAFRGTIAAATARPAATVAPVVPATPAPAQAPVVVDAPVSDPAPSAEAPAPAPVTTPVPASTETTEAATAGTEEAKEIEEAATALLALSWQALGPEISKGGIPTAVVQRALDIELAKPDADQRLTNIKKLRAALGVN